MVMIASFKTATGKNEPRPLRQRLQETHVNYTGSHVTLYTVFVREYAQFSLLCTLDSTRCTATKIT